MFSNRPDNRSQDKTKKDQPLQNANGFPISLSHTLFPDSISTFEKIGMPFGCSITPFIVNEYVNPSLQSNEHHALRIARCGHCLAYINQFCSYTNFRWFCSLCGCRNNFTKSMSRYRRDDVKVLPELQNLMLDFPCNFRKLDHASLLENSQIRPERIVGEVKDPSVRPLVHVFIIQESMSIDALETTVESVTEAILNMHPDMYVVLLTFSNRIGVYKFPPVSSKDESIRDKKYVPSSGSVYTSETHGHNNGTRGANVNRMKRNSDMRHGVAPTYALPSVQYVHFTTHTPQVDPLADIVLGRPTVTGVSTTGSAFESQDPQKLFESSSDSLPTEILTQLNETVDFFDCVTSIGAQRENILNAVCNIADSWQSSDPTSNSMGTKVASIPEVLIGPTIEAITKWVSEPFVDHSTDINKSDATAGGGGVKTGSDTNTASASKDAAFELRKTEASSSSNSLVTGAGNILNLINSAITQISVNLVGSSDMCEEDNLVRTTAKNSPAPVEICSGVIMHLFFSAPQDLPPDAHPSCPSELPIHFSKLNDRSRQLVRLSNGAGWPVGLNAAWVESIAKSLAVKGVTVNLWSISSLQHQTTDLRKLSPLANYTSGDIFRCVLGDDPLVEKERFIEKLVRNVTRSIATKCILKLRTSDALEVLRDGTTGSLMEDQQFPSVYHMSSCNASSTIGFQFGYLNVDRSGYEHQGRDPEKSTLTVQLAFEYETLVEDDTKSPEKGGETDLYAVSYDEDDNVSSKSNRSQLGSPFEETPAHTTSRKLFSVPNEVVFNPSASYDALSVGADDDFRLGASRRQSRVDQSNRATGVGGPGLGIGIGLQTAGSDYGLEYTPIYESALRAESLLLSSLDSADMDNAVLAESGAPANGLPGQVRRRAHTLLSKHTPFLATVSNAFSISDEYEKFVSWRKTLLNERRQCYLHSKTSHSRYNSGIGTILDPKYKSKAYAQAVDNELKYTDYIRFKKRLRYANAYNHHRKLVVVRKLRVITLSVDCASSFTSIVRGTDMKVLSSLLSRQAFLLDSQSEFDYLENSLYQQKQRKKAIGRWSNRKKEIDSYDSISKGVRYMIDWLTATIIANVNQVKQMHFEKKKGDKTYKGDNLDHKLLFALIESVSQTNTIVQLSKFALGVINLLFDCHAKSQIDGGDFATELLHMIISSSPTILKKFFYPELHSFDMKHMIQTLHYPLALRQESMLVEKAPEQPIGFFPMPKGFNEANFPTRPEMSRSSSFGSTVDFLNQSQGNSDPNSPIRGNDAGVKGARPISTTTTVSTTVSASQSGKSMQLHNSRVPVPPAPENGVVGYFMDCGFEFIYYRSLRRINKFRMASRPSSLNFDLMSTTDNVSPRFTGRRSVSNVNSIDSFDTADLPRPNAVNLIPNSYSNGNIPSNLPSPSMRSAASGDAWDTQFGPLTPTGPPQRRMSNSDYFRGVDYDLTSYSFDAMPPLPPNTQGQAPSYAPLSEQLLRQKEQEQMYMTSLLPPGVGHSIPRPPRRFSGNQNSLTNLLHAPSDPNATPATSGQSGLGAGIASPPSPVISPNSAPGATVTSPADVNASPTTTGASPSLVQSQPLVKPSARVLTANNILAQVKQQSRDQVAENGVKTINITLAAPTNIPESQQSKLFSSNKLFKRERVKKPAASATTDSPQSASSTAAEAANTRVETVKAPALTLLTPSDDENFQAFMAVQSTRNDSQARFTPPSTPPRGTARSMGDSDTDGTGNRDATSTPRSLTPIEQTPPGLGRSRVGTRESTPSRDPVMKEPGSDMTPPRDFGSAFPAVTSANTLSSSLLDPPGPPVVSPLVTNLHKQRPRALSAAMEREISDSSGVSSSSSFHKPCNTSLLGSQDPVAPSVSSNGGGAGNNSFGNVNGTGNSGPVLGMGPEYCLESWLLNQIEERMVTMPNVVPRFKLSEAERDSAAHLIDRLLEEKGAAGYSLDEFMSVMKETVFCMMTGGLNRS